MQSMITIVAPIWEKQIAEIETLLDEMHNPANEEIEKALDRTDPDGGGTHFMSVHAIPDGDGGGGGHIILELTADGDEARAVARIVEAIGPDLERLFAHARDWRDNVDIATYLRAHRIGVGAGIFDNPGLCFAGTPGMTVERIRKEAELAKFVADNIEQGGRDVRPIDRLAAVRRAVGAEPDLAWALEPPPPAPRPEGSYDILPLIPAHPLVRGLLAVLGLLAAGTFVVTWIATDDLADAGEAFLWAVLILLVATLGAAVAFYAALRSQEKSDWCDPRALEAEVLMEVRRRENHCAQNHMISVTCRKPGFVRWVTLRLTFSVIGLLARRVYRPGFLGGISTIHAARWITVPGTRNLVFFSNYGGSWESYLEDFITRAHGGLTGVWSNSIGFPRSWNLFQGGATDGERFKRYARRSMRPTRFWYSAYPHLITDHIRCNAAMRRGLATALTNDEAAQWLALFGSAQRPDSHLETREIQCLVFGGLGFMKSGTCLLYDLPAEREKARAFMGAIYEDVGFGDGRKLGRPAVLTVALGPGALEKLGLPSECVKGFPAAFLEGMNVEARNRILGDINANAPKNWKWGREPFDLALLAYGYDDDAVKDLTKRVGEAAAAQGMARRHEIPLVQIKKPAIEPFGFVDGISQPIIRGSYQSYRKNDPIHLVEPGEFIIGYPDNRGNFPPEPELSPLLDPENRLPVADKSRDFANSIVEAPRAVARNGTFLVIRQLEQDVKRFWDYCWSEYRRLEHRLPAPYDVRPDYIAAKLVGRWRDGSSLVRNPYYPFPKEHKERIERRGNKPNAAGFDSATAVAAAGEPLGSETVRPNSNPEQGTSIAAPEAG
nr:hypothetical protein [Pseudomonadota bacterium]